MSTPVLNNGIHTRDRYLEVNSRVQENHLYQLAGERKPTDLGIIELFQQSKLVDVPLYTMASFDKADIIDVDDPEGRYSWRHPIAEELPSSMGDLDPTNVNKGRDGLPFRIQLNQRKFGVGDIITHDKMNGLELYIVNREITHAQNYAFYTVTIVNSDSTVVFDNRFLANGTKFFRVGSAKSAEGQNFSDMMATRKYREFYNYVGNARAHVSYSVSSRAELITKKGLTSDGKLPVTEIWNLSNDPRYNKNDPSIRSVDAFANLVGKEYFKNSMNSGKISKTYVTELEKSHIQKVATDIENYLMWGKGGRITSEEGSPSEMRLSVGLWKQTDNSFKHIFNLEDFTLDMFDSELFNFYNGRIDFKGPDSQNELIVQTGIAGMKLVSEAIERKAFSKPMEVQAADIGAIEGKSMDLSYGIAFTRFKIPFLANVKFVLNPALDPTEANDIENPILNTGYRLSSYSFIIFDITQMKKGNIKMLRDMYDNEFMWRYRNGNMDYLGKTSGFQSSGKFDGYEVDMEQSYPALFIEDPTKLLKFVMRNPITGGSL